MSNISPKFILCSPEIGTRYSKPKPQKSQTSSCCSKKLSILFTHKITGLFFFLNIYAISSSNGLSPDFPSTINRITSASFIATSACSFIFAIKNSLFLGSNPPVSTITNSEPLHSASLYSLSLVTPGRSSTIAILSPTKLLKRVDFPTFGLPTIATIGFILSPLYFFTLHYTITYKNMLILNSPMFYYFIFFFCSFTKGN